MLQQTLGVQPDALFTSMTVFVSHKASDGSSTAPAAGRSKSSYINPKRRRQREGLLALLFSHSVFPLHLPKPLIRSSEKFRLVRLLTWGSTKIARGPHTPSPHCTEPTETGSPMRRGDGQRKAAQVAPIPQHANVDSVADSACGSQFHITSQKHQIPSD